MDRFDSEYYFEYSEIVPRFLTESNYRNYVNRGKLDKIGIGGNGRKVMIRFNSLPETVKNDIGAVLGDLDEIYSLKYFAYQIKPDYKGLQYMRNAMLEGRITDKQAEIYSTRINWLNCVLSLQKDAKKLFGSKAEFWRLFLLAIEHYNVGLPSNYAYFKAKLNDYESSGYEVVIKNYTDNTNSQKISDKMGAWTVARWSDRVRRVDFEILLEEYNIEAKKEGEKPLKSSQTLRNYLNKPEIKRMWYGFRYGHLQAKEMFAYKMKTKLPEKRDSLWYSDGTKLNYFDKEGKLKASWTVYEISDAYSECLLGFAIGKSENYELQFEAARMALEFSGHKPYEWKYDNQGGHKKLQNEQLLTKLATLSITTRPYNGNSKTIESVFGRFQQKYMSQDWFFTGQNITTTKQESKANMEFVLANLKNLPELDEVIEIYKTRRAEWNAAPHPKTGISRLEMYQKSHNDKAIKVDKWDMVELFWLTREPLTYHNSGISMDVSKRNYEFEVLDENGMPDTEFRKRYLGESFAIKYDPKDMSEVLLYTRTSAGLKYIATAVDSIKIHRSVQEQEVDEAKLIKQLIEVSKQEQIDMYDSGLAVLKEFGRAAENYGLNTPAIPGLRKGVKQAKKLELTPALVLKEQSYSGDNDDEWWKQL